MTTKLTLGKSADYYRKEFKKKDIYVSSWADNLLDKMSTKKTSVDLIKLKVSDLGVTKPAKWADLLAKAQAQGYDLCPPEVGPALRLSDTEQEKGTWYYIGMESIADSDGCPRVFYVGRLGDGGSWLRTRWVYPGSEWGLGGEVVFRLRKSALNTEPVSPKSLSHLSLGLAIKMVREAGYKIYKEV